MLGLVTVGQFRGTDPAQFSALVAEYRPRAHVGTALTVQTSAGFLVTLATIRLTGRAADTLWMAVGLSDSGSRSGAGLLGDDRAHAASARGTEAP
jgi:hypothetical protein